MILPRSCLSLDPFDDPPGPDLSDEAFSATVGELLGLQEPIDPAPESGWPYDDTGAGDALWAVWAGMAEEMAHGGIVRVWRDGEWVSCFRAYCSAGGCDRCRKWGAVSLLHRDN